MRRTCISNLILIGRWKKGEKSGEPKTGEKILQNKQDTRSRCEICRFQTVNKCDPAEFWHTVSGIVLILMISLHIRCQGLFNGHKVTF